MTTATHNGVPWHGPAYAAALEAGVLDPVTEAARAFIALANGDPTRTPRPGTTTAVMQGKWIAVVSADLVVVGHGTAEEGSFAVPDPHSGPEGPAPARKGRTRGPKDYSELYDWLGDEGCTIAPVGRHARHRKVTAPGGRFTVIAASGSERRTFVNDVALVRRELGLKLRREA